MADINVRWMKDPDTNVTSYTVTFVTTPSGSSTPNPPLVFTEPQNATGDASGYSINYAGLTPTPPALNPGDSVAGTITSTDSFGQTSPPITPTGSPVVISAVPPPPTGPVGATMAQV